MSFQTPSSFRIARASPQSWLRQCCGSAVEDARGAAGPGTSGCMAIQYGQANDVDHLHAMQFPPPPQPQVRHVRPATGLREVTVTVRWIPLVTAAYGTRVARPARTTMLRPGNDGSSSTAG
jgi:hypothetical protein